MTSIHTLIYGDPMRKPDQPLIVEDRPLTEAEIQTALANLDMPASNPYEHAPGWYWLSFADDLGFRGVVILEADSFDGALTKSHRAGVNPGGEVQGFLLPAFAVPPTEFRNRLLDKEGATAAGGVSTKRED